MRRRAALVLIATAGAAFVAGGLLGPYVIAERGWQAVQTGVEEAIGSRLSADGQVQGRIWPSPQLIISGLEATAPGDPGGAPLFYADHAKLDFAWASLLTGRLAGAGLRLRSVRVLALPFHPPADIEGRLERGAASFMASFEGGTAQLELRPEPGGMRLGKIDIQAGPLAIAGAGRAMLGDERRLVLNFDRVRWADDDLGRADLAAAAERDGVLIERAALRRPDGGEIALFGLATTAAGALRFSGGVDARLPFGEGRFEAAARLTGTAGRDSQRLDIDDIDVRVAASQLAGSARFDSTSEPQLAAELRAERLDLKTLRGSLGAALAPFLAVASADLRLRAGELAWDGSAAQGAVIDVSRRGHDFALRELAVRDLAGAPLHATGRFVHASDEAFVFNTIEFRYGRLQGRGRLTIDPTASPLAIDADVQTGPLFLDAIVPTPPPLPPEPLTRRAAAAALRKAPAKSREWSHEPLPWPALPPITAELHLSAPSIGWRDLRLDVATFAGRLEDGVLTVDELAGLVHGGRIELRGRAREDATAGAHLAGTLRLRDLDLKSVLKAYAGIGEISGRLDGELDLSAAGQNAAELIASLDGKVNLTALEGVVNGFDLPRMSDALRQTRRPTDMFEILRAGLGGGRTPFRSLSGAFRVEDGVAHSDDVRLVAAAGEGLARGAIDLRAWTLALENEFRLTEHPELPPMGLKLNGPIDAPKRVFDIQRLQSSLLRRGRPAAR